MKPRPRIIRLIVPLLLLASGGAVINVAVAWGFAIWSRPMDDSGMREYVLLTRAEADHVLKPRFSHDTFIDRSHFYATKTRAIGRTRIIYGVPGGLRYLIETEYGLPQRGLSAEASNPLSTRTPAWSVPAPSWMPWMQGRTYLPLRPLWPGFAINTMFYAAILWLAFAFSLTLRRFIRARRGLCPACAYPVGASEVCTECGNAVTVRG
jgi:hypothetical protein